MDLSVFFAGTAGSVPTQRRGLPAYLLRAGGDRILFDCGEGTQRQLLKTVGLPELDAIFLTHFHLDHWLGVVGVVKTFDLRGRERPLSIYGPPGMRQTFAMIRALVGRTAYAISYVELDPHEEVGFDDYVIAAFPVRHRVDAFGYAFIEDDRPGHFDVAAARALGVTEGPDFGRLQRGETVNGVHPEQVTGDPRPGRVIVYSGDTQPVHTVEEYARDASLLIHEATFLEVEHDRARDTGHSTAHQAARMASDAGVTMLALTHLSTRYFVRDVLAEATRVFENTVVPKDKQIIEVPFPERGEPRLKDLELESVS